MNQSAVFSLGVATGVLVLTLTHSWPWTHPKSPAEMYMECIDRRDLDFCREFTKEEVQHCQHQDGFHCSLASDLYLFGPEKNLELGTQYAVQACLLDKKTCLILGMIYADAGSADLAQAAFHESCQAEDLLGCSCELDQNQKKCYIHKSAH